MGANSRVSSNSRNALFCCLFISILFTCGKSSWGQLHPEEEALRQLLSVGCMESAIDYVRARSKLDIDPGAKAWWTMREMECFARWALQSQSNAKQHWGSCREAQERYQQVTLAGRSSEADSRWPWLQWQQARCKLLQSQSLLASYLAAPREMQSQQEALELVREILLETEALSKDVKRRQAISSRLALNDNSEAPVDQLRALDADAQLLSCEALMVRWQLYPEESEDRAAALAEVRRKADEFLITRKDTSGRESLLLAKAIADLESGESQAVEQLENLVQTGTQSSVRILAASHLGRYFAKQRQTSRARVIQQIAAKLAQQDPTVAPLAELVEFEIELLGLDQLASTELATAQSSLVARSLDLGKKYGDYWRTRAEALLIKRLKSESVSDSQSAVDLVIAEVRQLTARGDDDSMRAAVNKLKQAIAASVDRGRSESALALSKQAAAILRRLNARTEAIGLIEPVVLQFSKDTQAAAVHRWMIESLAVEALKQSPQNAERRSDYIRLLRQQLVRWPESESSEVAREWLSDWCSNVAKRDYYIRTLQLAVDQCSQVEKTHDYLLEICLEILQLPHDKRQALVADWLSEAEQTPSSTFDAKRQTALIVVVLSDLSWTGSIIPDADAGKNLKELERIQAASVGPLSFFSRCAMDIAEIQSNQPRQQPLSSTGLTNASWYAIEPRYRMLLAVPLIDALDLLDSSTATGHWTRLGLDVTWLESLEEYQKVIKAGRGDSKAQGQSSQQAQQWILQQAAIERLRFKLGDPSAISRLRDLVDAHPRTGPLRLMLSAQLIELARQAKAGQPGDYGGASAVETLNESRKGLTQLAALAPSGSSLQLAARYALVRALQLSDQKEESQRLIKLTLVTQPNLSLKWKQRFENALGGE